MWWRDRRDPATNKAAMASIVDDGPAPGLLAYDDGLAIGWISVGPRASYGQLVRSRTYAPADEDADVWVIACVYVHGAARRKKVAATLLDHAIKSAFACGASAIEVYPPTEADRSDYMGSLDVYEDRGFIPLRVAGTRTVMRLSG
jgi:GNAT superfamily N-acetyltransferase